MNIERKDAKVFGLGFQKTGTTSLHHFLRRLGYRSVHWPHIVHGVNYQKLCIDAIDDRQGVVSVFKPVLDEFDAFTDVPFPALYEELYRRFPDSRFILLWRDSDDWWGSVSTHWRLDSSRVRKLDPYEYLAYNRYGGDALTEITIHDRNRLKETFLRHGEAVESYFRDKPGTLLVARLEDDRVGEKLCRFLGADANVQFPAIKRRSSPAGAPSMGEWR